MSFLSGICEDVANAPQLAPVNPGTYLARIEILKIAKQKDERGGRHYMQLILDLAEEPTAEQVSQFLGFVPSEEPDDKKRGRTLRDLQALCTCFGLPASVLDEDNWMPASADNPDTLFNRQAMGATGMVQIKLGANRESGKPENSIAGFLPPVS